MAWIFDNPLRTLSDDASNKATMEIWESESLGGLTENNNRLPQPVVYLLVLTIISAFLITAPLWGQRPTAAIYAEFVELMDSPEVQALATDQEKMSYLVDTAKQNDSKYATPHINHPISMDDLRVLRPQIEALKVKGVVLDDYTVVGSKIMLANFEGNMRADGTQVRQQPWWDKGYGSAMIYLIYFCIVVLIVVKRLPPSTIQPRHGNEHKLSDAEIAELSGQRRRVA